MTFPIERPRRLRRTETLRSMVRETTLSPKNFVLPLFAVPGKGVRNPVGSMPGVFQLWMSWSKRPSWRTSTRCPL